MSAVMRGLICLTIVALLLPTDAFAKRNKWSRTNFTDAPPVMSFAANKDEVEAGEAVQLSWATANLRRCRARGDWGGRVPRNGVFTTPPLEQSASFRLKCRHNGKSVVAKVRVSVIDTNAAPIAEPEPPKPTLEPKSVPTTIAAVKPQTTPVPKSVLAPVATVEPKPTPVALIKPAPAPVAAVKPEPAPVAVVEPELRLVATKNLVGDNESFDLSWDSAAVANCEASGDWSGDLALSGRQTMAAIERDSSYTIQCDSMGTGSKLIATTGVALATAEPPATADVTPTPPATNCRSNQLSNR